MQIHNVVVVFDVYAIAESPEEARKVILAAIASAEDPLKPSESNALPVSREREVREAWRGEKPFVADDVSDADFERCKGKTTMEIFEMLHVKPVTPKTVEKTKPAKAASP